MPLRMCPWIFRINGIIDEEYSALQSAAQELERQRATDSLKKGLEKRPEREELIERGSTNGLFLSPWLLVADLR